MNLRLCYFPAGDCEYVDGRVVERNIREIDHADVQSSLVVFLRTQFKEFWATVAVRVQVKTSRFRVPDVCLVVGPKPEGQIVTKPPFLVVEVLSPDDRADDLQEKVDDYLVFGVKYVWVVNPRTGRGYVHTSEGSREAKEGLLQTHNPEIKVPLSEILA